MIKKINVLGFNEYIKEAHPAEYERNLKEYENYSNWLNSDFLKLGHVYRTDDYSRFIRVFVLDGFKPIIKDNSYELIYDYLVHFSNYKEYDDYDAPGWVTLDQAYKMMLLDLTGTKDSFGKIINREEVKEMPYCEHEYRIVSQTEEKMEILYSCFEHHSYIDYNRDHKKYNRHFCTLTYKKYVYEKEDGKWIKEYDSCKNKIRLAAANYMGWCHDTDICHTERYDGCWKNLRELKMKYLGVRSLAKLPILFDDVKTLSIKNFIPYPIKTKEW